MAEIWPVNLTPADKQKVTSLAQRRAALGLTHTFAETIRGAVDLALTAADEELMSARTEHNWKGSWKE